MSSIDRSGVRSSSQPLCGGYELGDAEPFEAPLELVLDNYFDMLGVRLRDGRSFTSAEAVDPEAGRVAVLSEAL